MEKQKTRTKEKKLQKKIQNYTVNLLVWHVRNFLVKKDHVFLTLLFRAPSTPQGDRAKVWGMQPLKGFASMSARPHA